MSDAQRRSFDPNSPGAQRLLRGARMAVNPPPAPDLMDPVDVVLTQPCSLRGYHDSEPISRQSGEQVTVMRAVANTMVKHGWAERAG